MKIDKNIILKFIYWVSVFINVINIFFGLYVLPKLNNDEYIPGSKMMNSVINFFNAGGVSFVIFYILISLIVIMSVWLLFRHLRIGYILYVLSMMCLLFLPVLLPNGIFYFTYKTFEIFRYAFISQCLVVSFLVLSVSVYFFKGKI